MDCLHQSANAQNLHHAVHVVGDTCSTISVPTCLSVFISKCVDPIHDYIVPNGCSTRLASLTHLFRMLIEPALHRFENVLMLASGDPSLLGGGAAMLDGTVLASVGPSGAGSVNFPRSCSGRRPFTGRTNVNVLLRHLACLAQTLKRKRKLFLHL